MTDAVSSLKKRTGASHTFLRRTTFSDIAGWAEDDHAAAFAAFLVGAARTLATPPKTRLLGVDGKALQRVAHAAMADGASDGRAAQKFFERWFTPHRIDARGFVTGYYEPEVEASLVASARFATPLYRR